MALPVLLALDENQKTFNLLESQLVQRYAYQPSILSSSSRCPSHASTVHFRPFWSKNVNVPLATIGSGQCRACPTPEWTERKQRSRMTEKASA